MPDSSLEPGPRYPFFVSTLFLDYFIILRNLDPVKLRRSGINTGMVHVDVEAIEFVPIE